MTGAVIAALQSYANSPPPSFVMTTPRGVVAQTSEERNHEQSPQKSADDHRARLAFVLVEPTQGKGDRER